jgi:hypothetical protein
LCELEKKKIVIKAIAQSAKIVKTALKQLSRRACLTPRFEQGCQMVYFQTKKSQNG